MARPSTILTGDNDARAVRDGLCDNHSHSLTPTTPDPLAPPLTTQTSLFSFLFFFSLKHVCRFVLLILGFCVSLLLLVSYPSPPTTPVAYRAAQPENRDNGTEGGGETRQAGSEQTRKKSPAGRKATSKPIAIIPLPPSTISFSSSRIPRRSSTNFAPFPYPPTIPDDTPTCRH